MAKLGNKSVTVTINCQDNASSTINRVTSAPSSKSINVVVSCTNGGAVLNTLSQLASKVIPSKNLL